MIAATDGPGAGVVALDQRTGAVAWAHPIEMDAAESAAENKGARTGITRAGKTILFATYSGRLIALDPETGAKRWDFLSPEFKGADFGAFQQAVIGERVFYGTPKQLHAFEAASGKEIWTRALSAPISTGIAVAGDRLYFGTADNRLQRVDPAAGKVEASIATEFQPGFFLPAILGDTLVTSSKQCAQLEAYDLGLRHRLWSLPAERAWGTPVMSTWKGLLVTGDAAGRVVAIRPENGSVAWSRTIGGIVRGLRVEGDTVYAGNTLGELFSFPVHNRL